MKKVLFLMLGIVIMAQGCQTESELTDTDKEAMVQAVKQASQEYWALMSSTYNAETFSKIMKSIDENSDKMWQTEPVAAIFNLTVNNKRADDTSEGPKSWTENRISTPCSVQKDYYSVLSDNKVLEVIEGDYSVIMKDSTEFGPFAWVGTIIWANVDGVWKMQFNHNSWEPKSE